MAAGQTAGFEASLGELSGMRRPLVAHQKRFGAIEVGVKLDCLKESARLAAFIAQPVALDGEQVLGSGFVLMWN